MSRFSPRAILFDLDGLMVDSEPLWFETERDFALSRGPFEWTRERWLACIGRGMPFTLATMRDAFGIDIDEARDTAALHEFFLARVADEKAETALALKPGCFDLIMAAKGRVKLAVASSSASRLVHAVLGRFALEPHFEAIVTGSDVERHKPAPDIFLEAAARVGVALADCLVLEDSLAGVRAARAAGIPCIAVPEGDATGRGFDELADAVVRDLVEARGLIALR